jgi:hypothetical protein
MITKNCVVLNKIHNILQHTAMQNTGESFANINNIDTDTEQKLLEDLKLQYKFYQQINELDENTDHIKLSSGKVCPICYFDLQTNNSVIMTECGHIFCGFCADISVQMDLEGINSEMIDYTKFTCGICRCKCKFVGFIDGFGITGGGFNQIRQFSAFQTHQNNSNQDQLNIFNHNMHTPFRSITGMHNLDITGMHNLGINRVIPHIRQEKILNVLPSIINNRDQEIKIETNQIFETPRIIVQTGITTYKELQIGCVKISTSRLDISKKELNDGKGLIIIIDDSGSMTPNHKHLKEMLINFTDQLPESTYMTIIVYGSNAKQLFPFRKMTRLQKETVKSLINSYHDMGSTDTQSAIELTCKIMEEMPIDMLVKEISSMSIIEFTDGDADTIVNVDSPCMIKLNQNIKNFTEKGVYSQYFASSIGPNIKYEKLRDRLGLDNEKNYHHIENISRIANLLELIQMKASYPIFFDCSIHFGKRLFLSNSSANKNVDGTTTINIGSMNADDEIILAFVMNDDPNYKDFLSSDIIVKFKEEPTSSEITIETELVVMNSELIISLYETRTALKQLTAMYNSNSSDKIKIAFADKILESTVDGHYGFGTNEVITLAKHMIDSLKLTQNCTNSHNLFHQARITSDGAGTGVLRSSSLRQYSEGLTHVSNTDNNFIPLEEVNEED